jgi:hypothetical protein
MENFFVYTILYFNNIRLDKNDYKCYTYVSILEYFNNMRGIYYDCLKMIQDVD